MYSKLNLEKLIFNKTFKKVNLRQPELVSGSHNN